MADPSQRTGFQYESWVRSLHWVGSALYRSVLRPAKLLRPFWSLRRGVALVLAGIAGLALLGLGSEPQSPGVQSYSAAPAGARDAAATPPAAAFDPTRILPATVLTARRENGYEVEERHAGLVAARRLSALGFARSGLLSTIEVNEGDRVAEGNPLARLDTRGLEARANELRSELAESRSRLEVATVTRDQTASVESRSGALAKKDWVSKKAHDDTVYEHRRAVAERAAAQSAVRHVEAALAGLQVELDQSVLTAPYAGTIIARRIDEGAAVTAGEAVMDLIESDVVEFRVGIPETTAAPLKTGLNYPVEIAGRETPCRLLRLLPQVEASTRTVTAVFALPPIKPPPLSGMLGRLITRRTLDTPGFWLPLAALTDSRRGLWAVYVVEPDAASPGMDSIGILSRRDVQLIHVDGDRAFVAGVLEDGERVVSDGIHRLVPGLRVQIAADSPANSGGVR